MSVLTPASPDSYRAGPHRVALVAAVLTLPLLFVGGSVTSYGVGLAVPDWPTTFGINMFLYDFWNAPFGVRVEHTHRLYGAAVGLATVFLAVWFLAFEFRRSMKVLGVLALVAVIVQGVLGGTRVTQTSTFLAAVHGCLGQAFFGLMVAFCVLTGRGWREASPARPDVSRFRARSTILLFLVYTQVIVGAWFRHFHTLEALAVHLVVAAGVLGFGTLLVARILRPGRVGGAEHNPPNQPQSAGCDPLHPLYEYDSEPLRPSARAMLAVMIAQVGLGLVALLLMLPLGGNPRPPGFWQAVVRTTHQTNGALLLAASVVLMLRAFRHFSPAPEPATGLDRREPAPAPAPRLREAVA